MNNGTQMTQMPSATQIFADFLKIVKNMTRIELEQKLNILNINCSSYSLDGDLKPDSIILYNSYDNWTVFYLDERGGRNNERIFKSQELAYDYICTLFEKERKSA